MKTGGSDLLRFCRKVYLDKVVLFALVLSFSLIGGCVAVEPYDKPKQEDTDLYPFKDTDDGAGDTGTVNDSEPADTGSVDTEDTGVDSETDKDSDSESGGSDECPNDPDKNEPGICGCGRIPFTCEDLDGACGTQEDGCGGFLECGCPDGQSCSSGRCVKTQPDSAGAPIGSTITIHTFDSNGGYIWAHPGSGSVAANSPTAGDWGRFVVESGSSDRPGTVALRHVSSGKYLTCRCGSGETGEIRADVAHKFAWESFTWNDLGAGKFSLTADNGRVVWTALDKASSPVAAYSWSTDASGFWAQLTYAAGEPPDSDSYEWGSIAANLPPPPAGYQWQLNSNFTDEFHSWDSSKWQAQLNWWDGTGPGRPGAYVAGQNAWDTPNVDVKDGRLMIYTKANGPSAEKWLGTGVVSSKTKAPPGYYEVRMKASAISTTSAFWFQDPHVAMSEIDVIEAIGGVKNKNNLSFSTNLHSNVHYFPNGFGGAGYAQQPSITTATIPGGTTSWHTYGVWWRNAHEAFIYLDGQRVANFNEYGKYPNDWDKLSFAGNFDEDMTMIFDSEVWDWEWQTHPGASPGLPTLAEVSVTDDSNAVQIDWVRGYRLVPNGQNPVPIGLSITIHTSSADGGYVWADPGSGSVAASSPTAGDWGRFVVESGSSDRPGTVAFRHVSSGKYLSCRCGPGDTGEIRADITHKYAWESFTWNDLGAGKFSLTADNGRVVFTSLNLGNQPIFAYPWSTNPGDSWAALTYSVPGQ